MQKATDSGSAEDARTKEGMKWIGRALEKAAGNLGIAIQQWGWESDPARYGDNVYSLVVVGNRHKRAVKFFNRTEIDQCPTDPLLQQEIMVRLTRILIFIGPER